MKKGKLLLSLGLISLAIAILCFGVLSAVTVNYNISGNITYSIQDVFVKINTRVYKIAAQQDKATVIANVKELETTPLASISTSKYTLSQTMVEYDSTDADTETVTHTAKDSSGNTIQIAYGDYYTYYIVINIQNLTSARNDVCAYLTDKTTCDTNSVKTTNLYQNNIKSTETRNIVIAYSIKDKTSEVSNVAIDYSLKVSYETTGYTSGVNITNEIVNSVQGYYITLGKTTANVATDDIKWRLVSLDGLSKYTYSASNQFEQGDNARYLSDAVFLQETTVGSNIAFDGSGRYSYFSSTIRNGVKGGAYIQLTGEDLSFVKNRKIDKINYWKNDNSTASTTGEYVSYDSTINPISNTESLTDKFWLLSCEEVTTFFDRNSTSRKWTTSGVAFWLRTPKNVATSVACYVSSSGEILSMMTGVSDYNIRAAFQLA